MIKSGYRSSGRVGALFTSAAFFAVLGAAACGDNGVAPPDAAPDAALTPAALAMTPPNSDFGTVTINSSSSATNFTVTNGGQDVSGTISAIVSGAAASDFTVANSCSTLNGAGTCIVSVTFSPIAAGPKTATLIVSASPGGTVMATLSGAAVNPGTLSIAPQGNQSFGNVVIGATGTAQTFTVMNTGGVTTGTLTVTPAGSDPNQFTKATATDLCNGMTLAAGASCTFRVNFAPTSTGAKAAQYIVSANPGGSATASVSGNGVDDALIVSNPPIGGFGSVTLGSSSTDQTFTITNSGDLPTTALSLPVTSPTPEFFIVSQNCMGVVLTPNGGNSCAVLVRFTPAVAGARSGTLTVSATTGGTRVVALSGTGNSLGSLSISPNPNPYGNVTTGQTANQTFTVTNGGATAAGPLVITVSGEFQVVAGQDGCTGQTLAPLTGSCQVVVAFAPTSGGFETGTLTASAGAGTPGTASLTGTGIAAPFLSSSAPNHDFGSVVITTPSAPFTFTFTNTGGVATSVPTVGVSGTNAGQFAANNMCTAAVAPGNSCTVSVTFTPATVGPKSATLNVSITPGNTLALPLSGDGITNAQIIASPSSLPFNDTFIGDTSQQIFTVTNNGSVTTGTITITETGANQGDYSQTNNCTTLANGQSCTVTVTFAPTAPGTRANTFSVSGTPGGVTTVAVTGVGVPRVEVTDPLTNPFNFGTEVIGGAGGPCRDVTWRNNTPTAQTFTINLTNFTNAFPGGPGVPLATNDYSWNNSVGGIILSCDQVTQIAPRGSTIFGIPTDVCSINVCFDPTTVGTQPGNATLAIGPGGANNTASQDFTGVGTSASLTISPGDILGTVSPFVYADTITGQTTSQVFTVSNQSGASTIGNLQINQGGNAVFHIVADMCSGAPLANNATCTFTVVFAPTANGSVSGTLQARDASSSLVADAAIAGTGVTAAQLTTTGGGAFGTMIVGDVALPNIRTITVGNSGSQTTGPITVTVTGAEYVYLTGAAGDCISGTTTLTMAQTCTVRVRFLPTVIHADPDTTPALSVVVSATPGGTVTDPGGPGTSRSPIFFSAANPSYGDVPLGTTADRSFSITNRSASQTLTFGSGVATNAEFTTVSNMCGTLAPSATCTIGVRFAPTGTAGIRSGVTYTVNMTNGIAITTGLNGNARNIANIAVNPVSYDFGSILAGGLGTPPFTSKTFTVSNLGWQTAGIITFSVSGSTAFTITGGTCSSGVTVLTGAENIPVTSTCTIIVRFAPLTGQTGPLSGMLNVSVPTGPGNSATSVLLGNGLSNGNVTIINTTDVAAGPTADFGSQALNTTGATQVFNVLNTSGATVTLSLAFPADFVRVNTGIVTNCGATLAAGANCNVGAAFSPTSSAGAKSGQLVAVTGVYAALNGIALSNTLFGPLADQAYGNVDINAGNSTVTVTIKNTNSGTTGLLATAITGVQSSQFNVSGCALALAPGDTCVLTIGFDPTTTGAKTATLTLSSANGLSLSATLTGTGVNTASLSITPTGINPQTAAQANDGSRALGALDTVPSVFTVSNASGSASSGPLTISITNGANFVLTAPGTGTPCNITGVTFTSLGDGASCTIGIFFHPTALGAQTTTLTVTGAPGGTVTGSVTGTGTDWLTLNGTNPVALTANANTTLTFTNNSSRPSTPMVTDSTGLGTQVALIMDNCFNVVVPAGGTCTVVVRYVPDGTLNPTNASYSIRSSITTTSPPYGTATTINGPIAAPLVVTFTP